jgi:protein-glucosylgalactosylhydroxylysine glucosidase
MFVPRTFGNTSYLSFSIENLDEGANLKFGLLGYELADKYNMDFAQLIDSTVIGDYRTVKQNRPVSQALKWKSAGLGSISTEVSGNNLEIYACTEKGSAKLELFHSIRSYEESSNTRSDVLKSIKHICELGRDELFNTNSKEWKRIWRNGLAFRNDDFQIEKSILVHQFYYLCSLEICDYPLGPLGLSKNEWGGNQLWDADFWTFRAIVPLWPDLTKSIINFRKKTLNAAKEHARVTGYKGAWYPWQTDDEGRNITLTGFNEELHVNVWIALAAWEYYVVTGDKQFLSDTGWPIISSIADFFVSRLQFESDGLYHLNIVLGPDEAVYECGRLRVNDNFLTNFGVKKLMGAACKVAGILGTAAKEKWSEVKENIYLPVPDANGIIPEYRGYIGHGIKQADVILAFYPLGYEADSDIIRKNIKYYRDKQMYYGPFMSSQIESCIIMKLGEKEKGLKMLFSGIREYTRGKHYIPFECRDNDNSIMLTGIGGELQALIFGYYEADLNNFDKIPRLAQYMD